MSPKTVFISYRQQDDAQRARVRLFGERIRASGVNVVLDQFYLADYPGGPSEGWPKWSSDQAINSERVIIIGTEAWFRCFELKEQPGEGLGAACEANQFRQRIYDAGGINENLRVVIFDDRDADHISSDLKRYHHFHADRDLQAIINWLVSDRSATAHNPPKPGAPLGDWRPSDGLQGASSALPDDVEKRIQRYRACIEEKNYDDAFVEFFQWSGPEKSLNYLLDFVHNRCDLHLELVKMLFADGVTRDPPGLNRSQCAKALNALARAYKNTGRLQKAIETFRRQLKAEPPSGETGVLTLQNFVNALRLAGHLREATQWGDQLLQLSHMVGGPKLAGYGLYWNGIVASVRGNSDSAELLLRQAEGFFEEIALDDHYRGLGRTYAHLAQLELWSGNAEFAGRLAAHSYRLAQKHDEARERIFTSRLRGIAALMRGDHKESRRWLEQALASATATGVGYEEEELAAMAGLAELDHRDGNLSAAEYKLREVEDRARRENYRLLRADVLNSLARVLRDDLKLKEAVVAAQDAHEAAWCDSPPYSYGPGLRVATQLLAELGAVPPSAKAEGQGPSEVPAVVVHGDPHRLEKARWRCQFAANMRVITGPYRYAPTKFIKLLREDWDAVCQIVRNREVTLAPQHVEIHVGEPCNLNCAYCRGELRDVPEKGKFISRACLKRLVDEIHELNPKTFIRFSGLIGEPLLHPHVADVFNSASAKGLKWGVTTNGIRMVGKLQDALLRAVYVHVSLDAGSDETYQRLKKGQPGAFDTVLDNIKELVRRRKLSRTPQVIVSVLLQPENYRELIAVGLRLKGLRVDSLEVKMQHFDARRHMSQGEVDEAYRFIEEVRRLDERDFHVVVVQCHDQALAKVRDGVERITFPQCYANALGLNATVSPDGRLQTCCQYYQRTLGSQGSLKRGFRHVWESETRKKILTGDPRGVCVNCSPSDEFVNEFVGFLRKGYETYGEVLLAWVKDQVDL